VSGIPPSPEDRFSHQRHLFLSTTHDHCFLSRLLILVFILGHRITFCIVSLPNLYHGTVSSRFPLHPSHSHSYSFPRFIPANLSHFTCSLSTQLFSVATPTAERIRLLRASAFTVISTYILGTLRQLLDKDAGTKTTLPNYVYFTLNYMLHFKKRLSKPRASIPNCPSTLSE